MGETLDKVTKPISSIQVALAAIGLAKSLGLIFMTVLIEWSRAKAQHEEDVAEVAKTNLDVMTKKGVIDAKNQGKGSQQIIDEFLNPGLPPDRQG